MSGVKNIIQQQTKGTQVPTNADYAKVGRGSAEQVMRRTSKSAKK